MWKENVNFWMLCMLTMNDTKRKIVRNYNNYTRSDSGVYSCLMGIPMTNWPFLTVSTGLLVSFFGSRGFSNTKSTVRVKGTRCGYLDTGGARWSKVDQNIGEVSSRNQGFKKKRKTKQTQHQKIKVKQPNQNKNTTLQCCLEYQVRLSRCF